MIHDALDLSDDIPGECDIGARGVLDVAPAVFHLRRDGADFRVHVHETDHRADVRAQRAVGVHDGQIAAPGHFQAFVHGVGEAAVARVEEPADVVVGPADGLLLLPAVAGIGRNDDFIRHLDVCLEGCRTLHDFVDAVVFYDDDGQDDGHILRVKRIIAT